MSSESEWSTLLESRFVELKCINQLSCIITSLCDEHDMTCHSCMCGFVAIAISSRISTWNSSGLYTKETFDALLRELRDEEALLPYIRSAVKLITRRRDLYLQEHEEEFAEEKDRYDYRRTLVGGQEIAEWVAAGSHLSCDGKSNMHATLESDKVEDRPVFLRNVATGPPGEVTIRYKIEEYQKHADERLYIAQELPFCDGSDFFIQTSTGTCVSLEDWCGCLRRGEQNCAPIIAVWILCLAGK